MEESGRHVAIFTAMTNDVLENATALSFYALLISAPTHFCSGLVHIFALGSYTFLMSARTQFCSRIVRNFALGSYAILLLARTQFCSWLVRIFAPQPPLVPIYALQPLLVRATYRATVPRSCYTIAASASHQVSATSSCDCQQCIEGA